MSLFHAHIYFQDTNIGAVIYRDASATDDDRPYDRNSQVIYSLVPGNYSVSTI